MRLGFRFKENYPPMLQASFIFSQGYPVKVLFWGLHQSKGLWFELQSLNRDTCDDDFRFTL